MGWGLVRRQEKQKFNSGPGITYSQAGNRVSPTKGFCKTRVTLTCAAGESPRRQCEQPAPEVTITMLRKKFKSKPHLLATDLSETQFI